MKNFLCSLVLMIAFGVGTMVAQTGLQQTDASTGAQANASSAENPAQLSQKVDELEALVKQLQSELTAMKQQQPHPGPRGIAEVASTSMPSLHLASLAPMEDAPAAAAAPAPAPEKVSLSGLLGPTTLSGFVDVFYGYNSNQPVGHANALHNFDMNSSEIGLNMLELVADKAVSSDVKVGYHIALGFGQAMNQINGLDFGPGFPNSTTPNFAQNLKEAYLEYMAPVGKGLQINVGKFATPAGAEVIETKDNWNYTRGLLFALAIPYTHTGLSAKYAFNSKVALTGYLVNGWNNSSENNLANGNTGKTTGFSLALTPSSKFGFIENYLVGPEGFRDNSDYRHLSDTVVTFNPSAKLSLMANFDYGHDSPGGVPGWWSGIAGYIKYAPNDKWAFATRGEWYNDHDGITTGVVGGQHLSEFTLTAQRMLAGKLMSRLEFRRDMSDHDVFPYRDPDVFGPIDHQNTITLGLVYAFSSADAK
ncbi:MAG TPA: porin [Terriglobales bacterium]|nr:porin [Terriglobales bacterium]